MTKKELIESINGFVAFGKNIEILAENGVSGRKNGKIYKDYEEIPETEKLNEVEKLKLIRKYIDNRIKEIEIC
ncbi:MAG: hypothetical protein AAF208_06670 [Cyanobacteria bacterium P01_A01_bin.45]